MSTVMMMIIYNDDTFHHADYVIFFRYLHSLGIANCSLSSIPLWVGLGILHFSHSNRNEAVTKSNQISQQPLHGLRCCRMRKPTTFMP